MAEKKQEPKIILEREYIVPLRKGWLKVPKYKRANKAVKTLKEFLARHMKIYDNDLRRIKLDVILNNEIRFRGMKNPPAKLKIKAKKFDDGIVRVELVKLPKHIEFMRLREKRREDKNKSEKKAEEKIDTKKSGEEKSVEENKKDDNKSKEEKNDEKPKVEVNEVKPKHAEKHVSKDKGVKINRKALSR